MHLPRLNAEQAHAYNQIIASVDAHDGSLFFLNGPGGTGKTFVYNVVCHKVRSEGLIALCVASSGIAALLLRGGRTSHSMFKIPIELSENSTCAIPKESQLAGLIRQTDLIVWDEVPMQHRFGPEAVDRSFRDIRNDDRPFGGITVVFGGDFQQTLPVITNGTREEIVGASLRKSPIWDHIKVLHLTQNMRLEQNTDAHGIDFASWLLDVGHGRLNSEDDDTITLPDYMHCADIDTLIKTVYNGISSATPPPPEYFLNRMLLSARNDDVHTINDQVLDQMVGEERCFISADSVIQEAGADQNINSHPYPVEFLRSLNASGLPRGELKLKIGCPLILLRNLAPSRGLCNGTRMILRRMSERVLEVELIGGDHHGEIAFIPRISIEVAESAGFSFRLRRRQFPVHLAFSMSINKAQGQSVKFAGIDLRTPVFTHGQLYVALSRVTDGRNIRVVLPNQDEGMTTRNIVYKDVLLD